MNNDDLYKKAVENLLHDIEVKNTFDLIKLNHKLTNTVIDLQNDNRDLKYHNRILQTIITDNRMVYEDLYYKFYFARWLAWVFGISFLVVYILALIYN